MLVEFTVCETLELIVSVYVELIVERIVECIVKLIVELIEIELEISVIELITMEIMKQIWF